EYECLTYSGLGDAAFTALVSDDEVEVLEHTPSTTIERAADPQTGQPIEVPIASHDVKIKRISRRGRLMVACLPPEEFLIERGAKSIEDARFVAHRSMRTRQSLIEDGYERQKVMALSDDRSLAGQDEKLSRWDRERFDRSAEATDPLMVEVEVFES